MSFSKKFDISNFLDINNLTDVIETLKILIEKQVKLVFLAFSFGEPFSTHCYSLKFIYKYLKDKIDFPLQFMQSMSIQNFQQKLQSEVYPQNSAILFQNINLISEITGSRTYEQNVQKLFFDERYEFLKKVSEYSEIYVQENKYSLGRSAALDRLKGQQYVSGIGLNRLLSLVGYAFWEGRKPCTLFLGGSFSMSKLLAIQSMAWHVQNIVLLGRIGVCFYMVEKGLTELCGIALDPETIEAIRRFREKFEEEWLQEVPAYKRPPEPPRAQIVVPTDLLVCRRTDEEKHSEAYGRVLNEQAEVLGEQNQGPEFMVIDNGPDTTQRALECLSASLKVVVLDSVLPKPYYKRSGTQFYKTLFEIQRAKAQAWASSKDKDYSKDKMIVLVGDHEVIVNDMALEEEAIKATPQDIYAQDVDDDLQETPLRQPNIAQVQDFLIPELDIVLEMLSGKQLASLTKLQLYDVQEEDIRP